MFGTTRGIVATSQDVMDRAELLMSVANRDCEFFTGVTVKKERETAESLLLRGAKRPPLKSLRIGFYNVGIKTLTLVRRPRSFCLSLVGWVFGLIHAHVYR